MSNHDLIPCYLTNRDLLTPVAAMVEHLRKCDNVGEITIIDCDSTYPPLLDWYDKGLANVVRAANLGPHAPWDSGAIDQSAEHYFVSDADLDISLVPLDFLVKLQKGIESDSRLIKVGLSLDISELPADGPLTQNVINSELKYWQDPLNSEWLNAHIDTTAAIYRQGTGWGGYGPALRSAPPYTARHLSWLLNRDNLTDEWRYYFSRIRNRGELLWSPQLKNQLT